MCDVLKSDCERVVYIGNNNNPSLLLYIYNNKIHILNLLDNENNYQDDCYDNYNRLKLGKLVFESIFDRIISVRDFNYYSNIHPSYEYNKHVCCSKMLIKINKDLYLSLDTKIQLICKNNI